MEKIGVIGYGSWATALTYVLTQNQKEVYWWFYHEGDVHYLRSHRRNPRYLQQLTLPLRFIHPSTKLPWIVEQSELIILAIPAAYLHKRIYSPLRQCKALREKPILSAIKGLELRTKLPISQYLQRLYGVSSEHIGVIAGPAHAEEVAQRKKTCITIALPKTMHLQQEIKNCFENDFIGVLFSEDIGGIEYASVLKNVYTLAMGVLAGMGLGDNYRAMAFCSCLSEMEQVLAQLHPIPLRNMLHSAYLGDFLVTAYSEHSRNRRLGWLVGKGLSVQEAFYQMHMVAEGYFALKVLYEHYKVRFPIVESLYRIFFAQASVSTLLEAIPLF